MIYNPYLPYNSEPTLLDSPFFDYIILFLIFGLFLFHYFLGRIFSRVEEKKQEKFIELLIIFSPIWLVVLSGFLIIRLPAIFHNEINLFIDIFTILAIYILAHVYYSIAAWPATLSYSIINILIDNFGEKDVSQSITFWSLIDRIKQRRFLVILFLIFCTTLVSFIDILFIFRINQFGIFLLISLGLLILYAISSILNYGKVNISRIEHSKSTDLKKAIENLSIVTGVSAPDFQILSHTNPTAFSIFPNFGKPTIFITAPLLNLSDKNDLEAIVGHEFAHIFSGRALYFKRINNFLIFLRIASFILLLLVLININPILLFLWLALLFRTVLNFTPEYKLGELKSNLKVISTILNPPFLIINFISYFIYYSISRSEEFYADLKTVEFTRYPQGLYSIIQKIKNYRGEKKDLPEEFDYLYFTGEETIFNNMPMSQPSIEERKEMLKKIDNTLNDLSNSKISSGIACPYCKNLMETSSVKGLYDNFLKVDYCKKCDSIWFNNWILWLTDDLIQEQYNSSVQKESAEIEIVNNKDLICPYCGVSLSLFKDKSLPLNVKIWYCPTCNGNWAQRRSVLNYLAYRKNILKKEK